MRIGTPKEIFDGEARVAMTPASARKLRELGHECAVESGAGAAAGFADAAYEEAGVAVVGTARELWESSQVVVKVRPPRLVEEELLEKGKTLISFFYPAQSEKLLEVARDKGINVIAMDMIPRISRAQKMDALSSMGNVAGYRAVLEAGNSFGRFFPGQMTAAGKVAPSRVLVIGAGVAGLSAIGTAKHLGAIVHAFDVRPEVAEQVESMGAKFLFLDFEEDASGEGGYAAPSSPEFREKQLACFREQAPSVDVVITTALIPGHNAPKLWLKDMVDAMKPGSVVVDLAAERGGNCDLTEADRKVVTDNGVTVIGYTNFPSRMAEQSSSLYATNISHMVAELTPGKDGKLVHDMEDDVIRSATVAYNGEITFPPPPLKVAAIAKPAPAPKAQEPDPADRAAASRRRGLRQAGLLAAGGALMLLLGNWMPQDFMQHLTVFVLSVFVGFQVVWNVKHALHTPLMAVTNAISGIIILGALLQVNSTDGIVSVLAVVSVLIATINIVGGFMVTHRMLQMFRKS